MSDQAPPHRRLHGEPTSLPASHYARDATAVAPDLLGKLLVRSDDHEPIIARIVEVEAYREADPASHAYSGQTPRTQTMFGPVGRAYVYFTYGMHWCLNVSCEGDGVGAAVLLRAAALICGEAPVRERRGAKHAARDLLRGPARLTQGFGLDGTWDGVDLTDPTSPLRIEDDGWRTEPEATATGPRTGVRVAPDVAWRWWIEGLPEVSRYSRHPRAARGRPSG
jgi:DNA-3-methyladenine glycosylase